jgi:hypothetical protein
MSSGVTEPTLLKYQTSRISKRRMGKGFLECHEDDKLLTFLSRAQQILAVFVYEMRQVIFAAHVTD